MALCLTHTEKSIPDRLNEKDKNLKFVQENIGEYFPDFRARKDFMKRHREPNTKERVDKFYFIKVNNFFSSKIS